MSLFFFNQIDTLFSLSLSLSLYLSLYLSISIASTFPAAARGEID